MRVSLFRLVIFLFLVCLSAGLLPAQDFRATISGQVTDASGAAIVGAKVKAVQRDTGDARETVTNQEGYYVLTPLQPSIYDIEVTAPGFQAMKRAGVTVLVAEKADIPFKLNVGNINEQVTVTADIDTLQTADASGGLNFDSIMTSESALNGRQVYMLMDLTPGVLFTQEDFGASGYSGTRGWDVNGNFTINGGKTGTNSFSLNGAPISLTGTFSIAPNVDAIQEFKVMYNTYDAAIARTGGGSVNTTVKMGTNRWKGSLSEFMRNSVFDANYTQLNAAGKPRGKHIVNQMSGTIGGPIHKDKDFVFFSMEMWRERTPFPVVADVPPLDLRTGQAFSKYNMLVYDPLTSHICNAQADRVSSCSSTYIRDAFAGNVIPESRISPIAKKILGFYPEPNYAGMVDNYVSTTGGRYRYDQPIVRYDRMINGNNRLMFTFSFQDGQEYRNSGGMPGPAAWGDVYSHRRPQNYTVTWSRTMSPRLIFDLRASFSRFAQRFPRIDYSVVPTAASLGITQLPKAPTSPVDSPPRIQLDQFSNLFGNTGSDIQTFYAENQWNLVPSFALVRGTQTIRFGVDLLYAARGEANLGWTNGSLQFNRGGTWRYSTRTSALNTTDGSGVGDLLLGIPYNGQVDWNDTFYRSWPYFGFYVQDDWKIRRNVTLNLGLRYDAQIPWVERWNRVTTGFDYNAVNPLSDQILANWRQMQAAYNANPANRYPYPDPPKAIYGGKTYIQPGGPRRTYNTDWTNIQPRLGVAWSLARHTVMRGGFGIFHRTATQWGLTDGYNQTTNYVRTLDGDATRTAQGSFTGPYSPANPFPDGLLAPQGREAGLLANAGNAVSYDARLRPIPRTYQYSFGIQRRIFWNIVLDTSYSGSQTIHDAMALNTDYWPWELNVAAQATNAVGDTTVPNPFYGLIPAGRTFGTQTIRRRELMRPYPLFANVTNNNEPWARYRYDALLLRADKRFSGDSSLMGGLTLIFSYTFSKNMQTANYLNTWNWGHEKPVHELVSFDKPQNVALSGVWSLPVGRGRHFAPSSKVVNTITGGWTMNWAYRYTSGTPVGGINAVNTCGTLLLSDQSHDQWWNNNKSCWRGNPGYMPRVVEDRYAWLRWQDNLTVNLAASKTFKVSERWSLNLRGEAFNLLNTPIWKTASTTYSDVNFGMLSIEQRNFPRNIQVAAKLLF